MYRMHRILHVALAALVAVSLAGCATTRVNGFLERGMDFMQYRSYTWAPADRFSTGDPRLDNNEFFQKRLRGNVDRILGQRGWELASSTTAGLIVHFHASVHQQIDVNELDTRYGYCEDCHSSVYDAGTITIDLVDAKTNKLVWRGWSEGVLDGIDDQSIMESRVDAAVTMILQKLPPAL